MSIEISGKEGIRTSQLAGPAHSTVNIVLDNVFHSKCPLFHRYNAGMKCSGRMVLIPGYLHYRTNFATELMSGAKASVGIVPPFLDEFLKETVVFAHVSSLLQTIFKPLAQNHKQILNPKHQAINKF
jgi:hypothetical protein